MGGASLWRQNATRAEGEQIILTPTETWFTSAIIRQRFELQSKSNWWSNPYLLQRTWSLMELVDVQVNGCRDGTTWLFDPGCADDMRMKCWCSTPSSLRFLDWTVNDRWIQLGLLPTERGFQMFPSYFHHFWLSWNNMGFWQNTVFGFVWWSSRAFMSSNRSDTSWAPGPWRRGESQGTGGRANSTSGILNLWARCPFHMSGLVTCWMEWSPFPSYRVLISIGRHWHTLPAQVTNYSSQRNCSANIVAHCRILARMLKHVKTSQQKVWGAWNQTRSRCWHLQVATA